MSVHAFDFNARNAIRCVCGFEPAIGTPTVRAATFNDHIASHRVVPSRVHQLIPVIVDVDTCANCGTVATQALNFAALCLPCARNAIASAVASPSDEHARATVPDTTVSVSQRQLTFDQIDAIHADPSGARLHLAWTAEREQAFRLSTKAGVTLRDRTFEDRGRRYRQLELDANRITFAVLTWPSEAVAPPTTEWRP